MLYYRIIPIILLLIVIKTKKQENGFRLFFLKKDDRSRDWLIKIDSNNENIGYSTKEESNNAMEDIILEIAMKMEEM